MRTTVSAGQLRRVLLCGAAVVAMTGYARAQEQGTGSTSSNGGAIESVVVTGSRIPRPESDLPIPVTTIGSEEIEHSGTTNLGDYLKRIPALTGSLGNGATSGYNTPLSDDGSSLGGLNLLDLRNLGYIRTLVLVDGHRTVSESTGGAAVDINTIPETLIDRVDVVTGGTSAIYGADGVSGVVNFVMKHDLEGIKARVQVGTSEGGGGSKILEGISAGHNFDDGKGNVTLTFEGGYQDRLFFTQRPFTRVGGATFFVANPADVGDNPNIPDNIPTNDAQFIYSAPTGAIDINMNLTPDHLGNGHAYILDRSQQIDGSSAIGSSGMPFAEDLQGDFQPLERRYVGQVAAHYDFSDHFRLSEEFRYANVDTKSYNIAPFDDFTMIAADNAFLPINIANHIAHNGVGYALLSEDYLPMRMAENVERQTYSSVLELQGTLPNPSFLENSKYDVSYVYGQANIDDATNNNRLTDRFSAALDSVIDPVTHKPTCRSNLNPAAIPPDLSIFDNARNGGQPFFGPIFNDLTTIGPAQYPLTFTPGPNSGCVPYNPFDLSYDNSKAIAWASATTHILGVIMQHVVNGYVSADVPAFEQWGLGGPLSIVAGGEYRKESSSSNPDELTQGADTFDGGINGVKGSFDVSEEFAEIALPIIKDGFIKEFSIDAAARHSDYSSTGGSTSWQYSGEIVPFDGLKFRGSQAFAVRAPNIGELFAPDQLLFSAVNDPCDPTQINNGTSFRAANCAQIFNNLGVTNPSLQTGVTTPTLVGGNLNLKPEAAQTYTAGIVITPPDWHLAFTVDWYRIGISNAIEALPGQTIADECVDLSTIVNPFCDSVTRTTGGAFPGSISQIRAKQINVARFSTSGVDFTANYHIDSKDLVDKDYGSLDFHLIGNYLDTFTQQTLPDEAHEEHTNELLGGIDGSATPRWQFNLDINYALDDFSFNWNIDWYNGVLNYTRQTTADQPDITAPQYIHTSARDVHSIQIGYRFSDMLDVYAGIDNLFYQKPAVGESVYPVDPLGRFFYVGVKSDVDAFR